MLNTAIKAARSAGALINRASLDLDRLTISAKSHNDFVTEVDRACEQVIIQTLLEAYPGHGILGEETGREFGARHSDYVWIIDPLDGTTNFIHGLPIYAVSIALSYKGKVEQAVVYDPSRNDLFYATKGRGAFLNDKRLRVSKRLRLQESLVGTGFPFRKGDNFKRYLKIVEEVMQNTAGLRRPGAASLDLCYVAAGWYDGFFETGLSPWDCAAGSLIITEAGGLVGNFTGEADFLFQRELVAGNPKIYAQLVSILAPYSRVIKEDEPVKAEDGSSAPASSSAALDATTVEELTPEAALARSVIAPAGSAEAVAAEAPVAPVRKARRITKAEMDAEKAAQAESNPSTPATARPAGRRLRQDNR